MYVTHPWLRRELEATKRKSPPPLPRPTLGARIQTDPGHDDREKHLAWGTITFIHETHFWYMVTFDAGYRRCYQWGCTS